MKDVNIYKQVGLWSLLMILLNACSVQPAMPDLEPDDAPQIGDVIKDIHEDRAGNLWFGTATKGLARYDGITLTYLSKKDGLCGIGITDIAEDNDGNLWLGTNKDMCFYDGNSFTSFPKTGEAPMLGWGWKNIKNDGAGNIWINTHQGMFRYEEEEFKPFNVPFDDQLSGSFCSTAGKIAMGIEDSNGNLWFGTDSDGVYKFDGTNYTNLKVADGLPNSNVNSVLEDQAGNLWFTSFQTVGEPNGRGGLCMYDGTAITQFPELPGLHHNNIFTTYEDRAGNIWIGATGVGVYRYDGNKFTLFKETNRMDLTKTMEVHSILEDRTGQLWFGFTGGLFRFDGTALVNVTTDLIWKD